VPKTLTATLGDIKFTGFEYVPDGKPKNITLFCLPGGGVTVELFDLAPEFSFAQRMVAKGYRVITMDHPGTASNPLPDDHPFLNPRKAADYIGKVFAKWAGSDPAIGIGHSMGGMVITLVQTKYKPFKAIALFGSSAGGLDWGLSEEEREYIEKPEAFKRDMEKLTLAKFGSDFIEYPNQGPSGKSITFGGETAELTQRLRDITTTLYAAGGLMSMTRGSFRKEVNAIDVPMFFAFGDHDIGIPPEDAPKDYINTPSTELVVLENTGHNSFAFSSVATVCSKLDYWASNFDWVSRNR